MSKTKIAACSCLRVSSRARDPLSRKIRKAAREGNLDQAVLLCVRRAAGLRWEDGVGLVDYVTKLRAVARAAGPVGDYACGCPKCQPSINRLRAANARLRRLASASSRDPQRRKVSP